MSDPCPIRATAAAIWAAAQAATDQPHTWTPADDIDPTPADVYATPRQMDDAADYHYRHETTPYWRNSA